MTYSPKVFLPLTMLCRDRCGYCTFAHAPRELPSAYLDLDAVLTIANEGARLGCHEALFTLGECPEHRYPSARRWLTHHGYESTVDYLVAACRAVLEQTGLLPHANAGALRRDELAALRSVTASQGMMIESLRPDLPAHRGAPDKHPDRRLATLHMAGELGIAFTTGILVGIGETETDRVVALEAIAQTHRRYGHVQEVIVQNFLPKVGTAMRQVPRCPPREHLRAIALARLVLPPEIHVQAPPNLTDHPGDLVAAGIDDWGGISPLTADHVNPERPWPALERLRAATEAAGHTLAPRLTIYQEYALRPQQWLDEAVRFAVLDRCDAEGLARDDPGAVFSETARQAVNVGDGAEVTLAGRRSTAWYAGTGVAPPELLPAPTRATGVVREVLDGVRAGQRPEIDELVTLLRARGPEVTAVAGLADELRAATVGDTVTYVVNRNINYTNVCTFRCRFCGFSKGKLSLNLRGAPYLLALPEIVARVLEAQRKGATEVCLQGGIHPSFDGDYYLTVCRAIHEAAPDIHIHGFTALEVTEGARRLGEPLAAYLTRLREAGLRSLPGTAAEILDDEVRALLCPDKITTAEWLEAHRVAHSVGLRSNVTMMFGAIEQPVHWARHLVRARDLQAQTGGFTEFVGLPYVHMATPMYLKRAARRGPTWREVLLVHAVARIALHRLIDHVQASWVKLGGCGARQLLQAGVDDLGGTLMDENISRAAGASHGQSLDETGFRAIVEPLGRTLAQRTTLYEAVGIKTR
ncbi:MAG: 5-amino-6-(D-ribitylamino)uracil--L-tyrosine 4-hydroxyphenyl transferase CofH [Actinomycetota bacterium]|nr:5-amino-6-(D-ribitylamino)uracil--L-tyrosine 4-hydroxyphenyl transferase CofH [Actinomycetota bacterium]MDQ3900765.1 5-amino-6-(D-ribitylamino)uracil--L-tyrosine 4-hydroxyphenyl transferase CofH [Actinomycetota bacterium]